MNPDAPLFIPAAFRQVEDFSPEWWNLVTTSTWFHDYWLSQHQEEDICNVDDNDVVNLLPDTIDVTDGDEFSSMEEQFEEFIKFSEIEKGKRQSAFPVNDGVLENGVVGKDGELLKDLSLLKASNGKFPKLVVEAAKYQEKPAKNLSPKNSLRRIQQPR